MRVFEKNSDGIHFFDRLAIYSHPYMKEVDSEYWTGHRRKKVLTVGIFTLWIRDAR
jgi:hypothetical protein